LIKLRKVCCARAASSAGERTAIFSRKFSIGVSGKSFNFVNNNKNMKINLRIGWNGCLVTTVQY
jgi:hypothetical protein